MNYMTPMNTENTSKELTGIELAISKLRTEIDAAKGNTDDLIILANKLEPKDEKEAAKPDPVMISTAHIPTINRLINELSEINMRNTSIISRMQKMI